MIAQSRSVGRLHSAPCIASLFVALATLVHADWRIHKQDNPEGPGSWLAIHQGDRIVAAWTYGEGQFKPYLHVFDSNGTRLTNSGLDRQGDKAGKFGHHRGIFIGWNRIESDRGRHDLWHMSRGSRMEIEKFTHLVTTGQHAVTEAHIMWGSGQLTDEEAFYLLDEQRRMTFSQPTPSTTQIDFYSALTAARDLTLGGDLQHAGVHFRAENEVATRPKETAYLWSPEIPVLKKGMISQDWQWATLIFPIGDRWYSCTEMTAPKNGFKELSWRDYGRFGFFDKKQLKKGQTLELHFRFLIKEITNVNFPADLPAYKKGARLENEREYQSFLKDLEGATK